jgi:uncharacterized membrane protein
MVHAGGFYGMHGAGFGFFNPLGFILFLVVIVLLVRFFVKSGRYGAWQGNGMRGDWNRSAPWVQARETNEVNDEALSVARERLAKGEINPEQFETIKGGLKVDVSNAPLGRHDTALQVARERFAKSEITLEEFEAVKKILAS